MQTQLAIDISNHQGEISREQFREMKRLGVRTVICGTDGSAEKPLVYRQQIEAAAAEGLRVEAYLYLYFAGDVRARTAAKLDMIQQVGRVSRVWLDCEDQQHSFGPEELVGRIAAARDLVQERGLRTGIYTGRWWWEPYTNNEGGFWDLPLWIAAYGPNEVNLNMEPLGGWRACLRKQYSDQGSLAGISPLDLDIELVEDVPSGEPAPDHQPEQPAVDRSNQAVVRIDEAMTALGAARALLT